jgi:hypothetical protein
MFTLNQANHRKASKGVRYSKPFKAMQSIASEKQTDALTFP